MRASELLGLPVRGPDGRLLGRVLDVRLSQHSRLRGSSDALRIDGFVVGRHRLAARLGYDRYERPGPALVRRVVGVLVRHNGYLSWADAELSDRGVRAATRELQPLRRL